MLTLGYSSLASDGDADARLQFARGDAERESGGTGRAAARGQRRREGGHDADDGSDEETDGHAEERGVESRDEVSGCHGLITSHYSNCQNSCGCGPTRLALSVRVGRVGGDLARLG